MPCKLIVPCLSSFLVLHLLLPCGLRTSCSLESGFWAAIEVLAAKPGRSWAEWASDALVSKPAGVGRASWLRLAALEEALGFGASTATTTSPGGLI
jgi:predicted DNA-binding ribbon-helix-helix protein